VDLQLIPDRPRLRDIPGISMSLRHSRPQVVLLLDRSRLLQRATALAGAAFTTQVTTRSPEDRHEAEVYLDTVRDLGLDPLVVLPSILPDEASVSRAVAFVPDSMKPYIVIQSGGAENPGATMLDKRWPMERYVTVAQHWSRQGYSVVLTGGSGDKSLASNIATAANLSPTSVLAGSADLATTTAILHRAALYLGGDTGISHIAAATGTPTVAIFGPTNPGRYRPLGRAVSVLSPDASWELPDVDLRQASRTVRRPSTASVTVEQVISAGAALLAAHDASNTR
jgi:ADP-heptose:LPS heptosyltransferase